MSNKALIDSANRGLNYGDGFFESLKWHKGEVLFLSKHLQRIKLGFRVLHFNKSPLLNAKNLESDIAKLIKKNKCGNFARIRILFFRNSGGFYSPKKNSVSYIIQTTKIKTGKYPSYAKGKKLGLFNEGYKTRSKLSNIKSLNSLAYVLAGLHAQKNKLDDCFILNDKQKVVDAVSSSVIIIKNKKMQFSPIADGGVDSVMKHVVHSLAIQNELKTVSKSITLANLRSADEILICNVSKGIEWVALFEKRRYKSTLAKQLQNELNSIIS
ncbi:MAG: aminotransferase class IV [Bacteroidia bacterium]|nr:aminotransferase class IV [Bacteroidia bacterium]